MKAACRLGFPVLLFACVSCLSRGPALDVRYFAPPATAPTVPPQQRPSGSGLGLGNVSANSYLDLPMIWRVSPTELRITEADRWVAPPAELVQERLREVLFFSGPFELNETGPPRLWVTLEAFEGVAYPELRARLRISAKLALPLGKFAVFQHTEEEPLPERDPRALARGLGACLDRCGQALVDWLSLSLAP